MEQQQHEPQQVQLEAVRPRLPSDRDERKRDPIPREDLIHRAWKRFHLAHGAKPITAALIVGGAALAVAAQVGAPEFAMGVIAAYVTYRMMRYGVNLKEALTETIQLEKAAAIA